MVKLGMNIKLEEAGGWWYTPINQHLWGKRRGQEFEVILSCVERLRAAWPNGDQASENKTLKLGWGQDCPGTWRESLQLHPGTLKSRKLEP